MATAKWRSAHDIFHAAEGRVGVGQPNLLDLLLEFAAYRDRILFTKDIGRPDSIEYRANRDIAPRLGIAWRPFGSSNSVIRIAYGLFHVSPDGNTLNNTITGTSLAVCRNEAQMASAILDSDGLRDASMTVR